MGRKRVPGRPFRKGVSGNPKGRPPKAAEVAYLARIKAFAEQRDIPARVLAEIESCAFTKHQQWAIEWWANKFYPDTHVAQKLNEDTGAEAGGDLLARLRDFFRPDDS